MYLFQWIVVYHRSKIVTFVVAPADDVYYYWLFVIASAVLYNWVLLVARYVNELFFSFYNCMP